MIIEAALVAYKLVISSFVIPFYYGSGSAKAKSYGSYGSGSGTGSATLLFRTGNVGNSTETGHDPRISM
jgi:hypothetical protein